MRCSADIKMTRRVYHEHVYSLEEMDQFLKKHSILQLTQYKAESLNFPVIKKIEFVILKLPKKKFSGPHNSTKDFCQIFFLKKVNIDFMKSLPAYRKRRILPNSFNKGNI